MLFKPNGIWIGGERHIEPFKVSIQQSFFVGLNIPVPPQPSNKIKEVITKLN